jgi:plastocyanin
MKNVLIALLIIIGGFAVGWYIMRPKMIPQLGTLTKTSVTNTTPQTGTYEPIEVSVSGIQAQSGETKGGIQTQNESVAKTSITYTDDGFHEPIVYIKLGTMVLFTNNSARDMWVASAPHPTHTAYPEFDQKKSVSRGGTYSFTFTKVGSWKFHNHMMPDQTGTIVVRQ